MPYKPVSNAKTTRYVAGYPAEGDFGGNVYLDGVDQYPAMMLMDDFTPVVRLTTDLSNLLVFMDVSQSLYLRRLTDGLSTILNIDYTGVINIPNATSAPGSPIANTIRLWSDGGEAKIMDASGNTSTFSPHNFEGIELDPNDPFPVTIHHENPYLGTESWIYLSKLARLVEDLTGEKIIYTQDITKRDWAADETSRQQQRDAEIAVYDQKVSDAEKLPEDEREKVLSVLGSRPQPYPKRTEPNWIKQRKNKGRT